MEKISPWTQAAIEQNRRWLTAYVLTLTGDQSECDDLVQETFRIAYEKMDSFESGTNFGGWLRVIARNICRRHCARRNRVPLISQEEAEERLEQVAAESAERMLDPSYAEQRKRFLGECMDELGKVARQLVGLRYGLGLSLKAVADLVGRNVSAVNVAIFRARAALSECIRQKEAKAQG